MWFCWTARDLWKDLEERFGHTSTTQQFSLEESLSELQHEKNEPISVFFTEIKTIWDEMNSIDPLPACTCAHCTYSLTQQLLRCQQTKRLLMFLMKLNDNFAMVRTNILMMEPLPIIIAVLSCCVQEEKHKEFSNVVQEPLALSFDGRKFQDKFSKPGS